MFERFTDRARRVVVLAQEEARMLNHNYIGTEHILLGLIREGEGVAAQVPQKLGADLNRVRQTVIQLLSGYTAGKGEQMPTEGSMPPRGGRANPRSPFDEREKIVLSLIHEGLGISEIAELLGVSEERVGEIIQAVIEKLKDV